MPLIYTNSWYYACLQLHLKSLYCNFIMYFNPSYLFPQLIVKHECYSPHHVSSNACNQQTQYKCSYYIITSGNVTNISDKLMTSKYIYYCWKIRDMVQ